MSEALVKRSMGLELLHDLERAGAVTETSLDLGGDITFEQYESLGAMLGRIKRMTSWLLGDWIIYGEATYGEKVGQAMEATGLTSETLRAYVWVCSKVAPSRRRSEVPFSVHLVVAGMTPKEQRRWLAKAAREGLSQRDLRIRIREETDALSAQRTDDPDRKTSERESPASLAAPPTTASGLPLHYVVPGPVVRRLVAEAVPGRDGYVKVPKSLIERLAFVLD